MTSPTAREWGRQQAAKAPKWSEEKWRRVGLILGVVLVVDVSNAPPYPARESTP
jgi:hypothetical protein